MPCSDGRYVDDCADEIRRLNAATRAACEALAALERTAGTQTPKLVSLETWTWWLNHKKADEERVAREVAAAKQRDAKARALAKLSPEELKALGF